MVTGTHAGEAMATKGKKSIKGEPELYDEVKTALNLRMTPTAKELLKKKAEERGLTSSELVERFARDLL
jgi:hypothetical protein